MSLLKVGFKWRTNKLKKRLFPIGLGAIIVQLILLITIASGIYIVICGIQALFFGGTETLFLEGIIGGILTVLSGAWIVGAFGFAIVNGWHNQIILYDDRIVVTGHIIIKKQGIQFPDEIQYSEIENVTLICANANSLKKRMKNANVYASLRALMYFEFTLKNGKTKWVFIEPFSKKQRVELLDMINVKAGLNLSYSLLEKKDLSIFKKRK